MLPLREVNAMLDIHSHFLPKIDDGSESVEMSLEMLRASKAQGVTTIVSTSHFYGNHVDPETFLRHRNHAYKKLLPYLDDSVPEIFLGAEVLYFPGIAHSEEVRRLAIEGTNLILIEMPFFKWSERILDEIVSLQYGSGLNVILAHVERYRSIQKKNIYNMLFDLPVYFQCNAEAFSDRKSRKLAFNLIDNDMLHFLGSDCHNTTVRPPNMNTARSAIEQNYSAHEWNRLTNDFEARFNEHKI